MSSGRRHHACLVFLLAVGACGSEPATRQAAPPQTPPAASTTPAPPVTPPPPVSAPAGADLSRNDVDAPPPITDADLPPLPVTPFPAARPIEIVRAVYVFAAKHPEVLSKVPCFCGCETRGHRHNDDCFVAARDARGRPTAWEPHGVG